MKSIQGHLLVASPRLRDPNFIQTVVLMVQHNEEGALGLILNRPTSISIAEAWKKVSTKPCELREKLHHGGPCDGPLMVLHVHEMVSQIEVMSGIHFSTEKDNIEWLVEQNHDPIRFFVGCAGWAPGQLEAELETGSWLTTPATRQQVFCGDGDGDQDQWSYIARQIARSRTLSSLDPKIIPEDPSLN